MQSGFTLYHMGRRSLRSLNLNIASHTYIINIHTLTVLLSYLPAVLLKAKLGFFQPQLHHQSTAYIYCMLINDYIIQYDVMCANINFVSLFIIQPDLCLLISANPPIVTCLIRALPVNPCNNTLI